MKKHLIIGFILVFLVAACGGPEKPKNLISKKDMVNILIDARLLSTATHVNRQKLQKQGVKLNTYVFDKYGIDSLQFALSNNYYAYRVKEYEEIYNAVTDSLESLKKALNQQKIKEEKEQKKREKDSIKALKVKDSLGVSVKKDSLPKLQNHIKIIKKEGAQILANPVSNTKRQLQK